MEVSNLTEQVIEAAVEEYQAHCQHRSVWTQRTLRLCGECP